MIIEYCPICGGEVSSTILPCNPPIYKKECIKCGKVWQKREKEKHIPFNLEGEMKKKEPSIILENCTFSGNIQWGELEITITKDGKPVKDVAVNIKEKKPELPVPDSIRIETVPYWKGIQFGNKQVLGMRPDGDSYRVERKEDCYVKPHKLIPCEYKELKVGDLAFRTDHKKTDFTSKLHYCFILPKNEYVYVLDNESVAIGTTKWDYWYKVVPR